MKAIFLLCLLVPFVVFTTSAPPPQPSKPGLPSYSIVSSILQKVLDEFKKEVDKIGDEVEKLMKAVDAGIQKLDPKVVKDLEDIVNAIIGLANAGLSIANGILSIIKGGMGIPSGILSIIQASITIFQDIVMRIIPDCIDIIKHLDDKQLSAQLQKQLEDSAATLQNSINQLQAELDKHHH